MTIRNIIGIVLVLFISSCAKEIYTDEDAARAQREAQKVGLTVLVRDMNSTGNDMGGFVISSSQCGDAVQATTSADGRVDLMMIKGEAVLTIEKDGYPQTTAIVSLNANGTDRSNTVVVIPMFSNEQMTTINGTVTTDPRSSSSLSDEPVSNAFVSIDVDMEELITSAFSGLNSELAKYRPSAIAYSSSELLQTACTDSKGGFRMKIPVTPAELTYVLKVQEIAIEQDYYSGKKVFRTNGLNTPVIDIHLSPLGN